MAIASYRLLFATLLILPVAREERPEEIVKAAIAAAGGAESIAKYPAGRVLGKGTMSFGDVQTPFAFEQAYALPGRFRTFVSCELKGQKWESLQVVTDGTAKQSINGQPIPLTPAALKELHMAAILNEIGLLTPLTAERKFSLKLDKQLKSLDFIGVLVQVHGQPEIRLAFDRKLGHLVRIAYKEIDLQTAKESELETAFDDFKTVSGLTRPTRATVSRDGKKLVELQIEKFSPLEKIDPKAFTLEG